jgi:hypothetical protein
MYSLSLSLSLSLYGWMSRSKLIDAAALPKNYKAPASEKTLATCTVVCDFVSHVAQCVLPTEPGAHEALGWSVIGTVISNIARGMVGHPLVHMLSIVRFRTCTDPSTKKSSHVCIHDSEKLHNYRRP